MIYYQSLEHHIQGNRDYPSCSPKPKACFPTWYLVNFRREKNQIAQPPDYHGLIRRKSRVGEILITLFDGRLCDPSCWNFHKHNERDHRTSCCQYPGKSTLRSPYTQQARAAKTWNPPSKKLHTDPYVFLIHPAGRNWLTLADLT